MQRDPDFYRRFFAEVYLYQAQYKLERPWRGLLILYSPHQNLGDASQFADFAIGKVERLYLADLITQTQLSPTLSLLQLIVLPEAETAEAAQRLLNQAQRQNNDSFPKTLDLVEAILINKFPQLSMEEILAMLDLKAADIKQTRFYQEVYQEGQTEGYKTGEADLICHLFTRRFAPLSPEQQSKIYDLSPDHLKALAEALFDFSFATDLGLGRSIAGCQHRSEAFSRCPFPRLSTLEGRASPSVKLPNFLPSPPICFPSSLI